MALTISSVLRPLAQQRPDAIAIQGLIGLPLSYQHLWKQVWATVVALNHLGIGPDDRVAVALPNGSEMAVAFLAIAAGATCAPLNPAYRAQEFEFYLTDLQAKALILAAGGASPAREVAQAQNIPILELVPGQGLPGRFSLIDASGTDLTHEHSNTAPIFSEPEDIALVLHTSGTTARPKIVPLTHRNLCQSADNIRQTLQLKATDRCLNVMPLFHIHGLVGCLLSSLAAGASVVCTPGFEADQFLSWLQECQPTWYSAVPTIHQAALVQAQQFGLPDTPLRLIRSSSAAMPSRIMAEMEATFGVPVIEAYGMTEASHQMTSNPLPPAQRKPRSVGLARQTEVAIAALATNELLPQGEIGEVVIRGEAVTQGYANNPTANASAFFAGWFRTGDQGCLDEEGYLFLQGRLKEVINRGGEKVSPVEVDEALMELPQVAQAVAFAVPHPTLGEDLAAAVVLKPGAQITSEALRAYLFDHIADFKVPSQIIVVNTIPKGATGKLQRIGLADKLADRLKSEFIAPRNATEQAISAAIQEVLRCDRLSIMENFFVLGGDSLKGTQVMSRLSAQFGIELPNTLLFRYPTVLELAAELERLTAENHGVGNDLRATAIVRQSHAGDCKLVCVRGQNQI